MAIKVLLTGFSPFLSYTSNPSGDIARTLNGKSVEEVTIVGRVLPVDHRVCATQLHEYVITEKPDVILGIGVSASRGCIALENIAINRFYFRNEGEEIDEKLYEDEEDAYFSTLPLSRIKDRLELNEIPVEYSFSADTYASNEIFYEIMRLAKKLKMEQAGFIHIPLSHAQVASMQTVHPMAKLTMPSMSMDTMENAIRLAIGEIAQQ